MFSLCVYGRGRSHACILARRRGACPGWACAVSVLLCFKDLGENKMMCPAEYGMRMFRLFTGFRYVFIRGESQGEMGDAL